MSTQPKAHHNGLKRWFFVTVVVLAFVFLVLSIRVFMLEANTSLGLSRVSGTGLQGLVVNVQDYVAPDDNILRPSQLSMLLQVVDELDSLAEEKSIESDVRLAFARILNQHTTSLSEYRWVRSTAEDFLKNARGKHLIDSRADSVNTQRMRMFVLRFNDHPRFFRDTLDREALI